MAEVRRILCCDGGGIRGIVTLRCLQALEARFGPCFDYFDMFAGTSTGAVIAAALARGMSVQQLAELYTERRTEIFSKRLLGSLHPLVTKYDKKPLRRILREFFADSRLADLERDVLITAVDTVRAETTFFSCFRLPAAAGGGRYGSYRDVRLRDAVEASCSAPTYFAAHGRFIDGGTTVYNNPAYMAAVEALRYSSHKEREPPQPSRYDDVQLEVYSFGSGSVFGAMQPGEAINKSGLDWVYYVLREGGEHASYQQSYVLRSELDIAQDAITFYRYELHMTPEMIGEVAPGSSIGPDDLALDAIDEERFSLLDRLGRRFADHLARNGLFDPTGPAAAAPLSSEQAVIVHGQNSVGRWERYGRPPMPEGYVEQVMREFDELDGQDD